MGLRLKLGEKNLSSANKIPSRSTVAPLPQAVFLPVGCLFLQGESGWEGMDQPWAGGTDRPGGDAMGGWVFIVSLGRAARGGRACASTRAEMGRAGALGSGVSGWVGAAHGGPFGGCSSDAGPCIFLPAAPRTQQVVASLRSPGYPPLAISRRRWCRHANERRGAPTALLSVACRRRTGRVPSVPSSAVPPVSGTARPFALAMGLR